MSTIDTSTWNPDPDLNESIEGIPLNDDASISQAWQAFRILMAAAGKNGLTLTEKVSGPSSSVDEHIVLFDGTSGLKLKDSGLSLSDIGARAFTGATASAAGTIGLVPAPQAGDQDKVLRGDGTWGAIVASDVPNIPASKITSGTIDLARLPAGALERLVTVADQTARFALTATDVQLGDTVKQLDTGIMYLVVDTAKLNQAAGYVEYTAGSAASVPWSGVTGKPSSYTPSSHTHGSITNDGKLGTASRVVVTDGSKVIGVSSVTTTKLGYLTDVTANIQGQIDGKADSATTLAGYGITDAKIASGVITLGSNTITPLTSASSLNAAKLTGTASVNTTGNAATATKLATPVTINGVSFDGSANIIVADSTKVAKAGDTMTGGLTISRSSPYLFLRDTSVERGTSPDSYIATKEILGRDKNNRSTWALYHTYDTDKTHRISLLCYNGLTTDGSYASISVGYDSNGNPYTYAPTPAEGDSTTKIATTYFVNRKCNNYLLLTGGTMTGALNEKPNNVNISVEPSSYKEDYRFCITRSNADTVHNGDLMRLGVAQAASTKDYRVLLGVSNPRGGNLPTQESIARGDDDSDAITSNCWGSIGVYYDYSKNRAYPLVSGCSTYPNNDSDGSHLATTSWVRNATGNFACNAATATKLAAPVTINGVLFDGSANIAIEDSAKLSLSGGTMTGEIVSSNGIVARRDNTENLLAFYGGTALGNGGRCELYGGTRSVYAGAFQLTASIDSSTYKQLRGEPGGTLVWDGQAIQTASDERLKTSLSAVPDEVLDAWEAVGWGQFRFLDAVEAKGKDARLHLGLIAQHVKAVFEERGLDACQYGVLCHEERPATEEDSAVDLWMIRYTEALALEAACQRRQADRLEARIAALEEAMNA